MLAVYLATRLWFIHRFPYFVDEAQYAYYTDRAAHSLHDLFISYAIGREPLFIWLGIPLVKLGVAPLTAVRLVSMLGGLLTATVVGLLGGLLGGTSVGLVAAGLCAVLPFFLVYDGLGTMESLVTLVMASALYVQIEFARRPRLAVGALLGAVLAAGVITKGNTLPALALLPLSLLVFDWTASDRQRRLRQWLTGVALAAVMVVGAGLLLRSSSRFHEFQHFRQTPFYTVRSLHEVLVDPFGGWADAWSAYRPAFLQYLSAPLLLVTAAGGLLAWRRDPRVTALLVAWIALPLVVALTFASHPFPRYALYVTPPMIVLMAYALVFAYAWARRRLPPAAASLSWVGVATLLLLPALLLDARILVDPATARYPGLDDRYVTGTSGGAAWPAVADVIRQRAGGRRVLILGATGIPGTLRLLLARDSRYVFVGGRSPLAQRARFAVVDELPFTDPQAFALMRREHFALVRRFARPRGGAVVKLYERRP